MKVTTMIIKSRVDANISASCQGVLKDNKYDAVDEAFLLFGIYFNTFNVLW